MCGIVGFVGSYATERIEAMNACIAHRGPDDYAVWADEKARVVLGHRRLSIIDLRPEGRQPMSNEDDSIRIVFNGEIYNYLELREELLAKGHRFKSRTDTEVILHLYEEEGAEAVRRLNGIFAFAIWDSRKQSLFLARDHIGVKPLYYHLLPDGIVFASELKALLVFPELSRQVDPIGVHQHLCFIWSAAPRTLMKGVMKLEPGYRLMITNSRVTAHEPYYDLPYDGVRRGGSFAERTLEIRDTLQQAVRRQMVSDVPVGAFLSGGVDSSSIVALMRQVTSGPIPCYTIRFDENEQTDENQEDLPYARQVAKHLGVELREVVIRPDVVRFAEQMVYILDEPQADPACINVYLICQQARQDGIKVLLGGTGGDDIFSGYRRHVALHYERYWGWLPKGMRGGLEQFSHWLSVKGSLRRRVKKYFATASLTAQERLMTHFLWTEDSVLRNLYTKDMREQLADYDSLDPLRSSLARIPKEYDKLNQMLYLEGKHFLPDHNLNYTDKMSMAHGVEVRVPLLDLELVRAAAQLPISDKLRGRQMKVIFKKAMEPYLPSQVFSRPKTGFGAPMRRWIREDLREMVRDVLAPSSLTRRGMFDPRKVQALIEQNEKLELDASYLIFGLMCIEMWMRSFIDAPRSTSPEESARQFSKSLQST